jgi:ArsR family transcriptional regulator
MNALQALEPEVEPQVESACCAPSGKPALGADEARQRALVFRALADPNRLRLLSIVKAGESGRPASAT